MINPEIVLPA